MNAFILGELVHSDADLGLMAWKATNTKSMSLLVKQYTCSRYEEADCLLKEALDQVSRKDAPWAVLREVVFAKEETGQRLTVSYVYEKLQADILSDLVSRSDRRATDRSSTKTYELGRVIQKSGHPKVTVREATESVTGTRVIAKIFGPYQKPESANRAIREAMTQAIVAHANTTKILDIWAKPHEDKYEVGFALERLSRDVRKDIEERQQRFYFEEELLTFLLHTTAALLCARGHGIAHIDIKPENIFLSDAGEFKLGDFGSAQSSQQSAKVRLPKGYQTTKMDGTGEYLSPEARLCLLGKTEAVDPFACDIYSLGVTLLEMASLEVNKSLATLDESILQQAILDATAALEYSMSIKSIIREMLNTDCEQRPVVGRIFSEAVRLLEAEQYQDPSAKLLAEILKYEKDALCYIEALKKGQDIDLQFAVDETFATLVAKEREEKRSTTSPPLREDEEVSLALQIPGSTVY